MQSVLIFRLVMADAVIGFAIQQLTTLTSEEISLSRSLPDEVDSIRKELEILRPFLKKVDAKIAAEDADQQERNEGIQNWIQQVVREAYRIEDVLDEFAFFKAKLHRHVVLSRVGHFFRKLKLRHDIVVEIRDIKSSLETIDAQRKRFDLTVRGPSNEKQNVRPGGYGIRSYYLDEDQIVGAESVQQEFINYLLGNRSENSALALVGGGGLGKTALAARVYKTLAATNCFDCHAWIEVEGTSDRKYLLKKLIREFHQSRKEALNPLINLEAMDNIELIEMVGEYLKEKRYMVVLDDVRKAKSWKSLELALVENNKGNSIIITTRNKGVADIVGDRVSVRVRLLEGLPADKAWELFRRKAFSDGVCPGSLEDVSRKVVEKCDGLPLAIVSVGSLLSKREKVIRYWETLLDNFGVEMERDINLKDCYRVLLEMFSDLPHHLKLCLLYFALFPAGYLVKRGRLIRLWIAEGFVECQGNVKCTPEEVAEGYLNELITRNLLRVSETTVRKGARLVRVHNLMYEIIYRKAMQFGFCQLLKGDSSLKHNTRRATIQNSTSKAIESICESKVRSVFVLDVNESPYTLMCKLFDNSNKKLVRLLDFKDVGVDYHVPRDVGNIFNLRYLSLRNTKVKTIPKTIGKLLNLETLDLKYTLVSELPNDVKYLRKLRNLLVCHLDTYHLEQFSVGDGTRTKIQMGIQHLTDLQKLTFVETDSEAVQELSKLRQLRKLGVRVTNVNWEDLYASISNMEHLRSLNLEAKGSDQIIDLQLIASPPKHLQVLYLAGKLMKLPNWISSNSKNLVKISLLQSGLTDDPTTVLHSLPNLLKLSLNDAYKGEQLHLRQDWFPNLLELILFDFKELKLLKVDDGALPVLQSLKIGACPLLGVPIGITNLRSLKKLVLIDMSSSFVSSVASSDHSFKIMVSYKRHGIYTTETEV